MEDGRILVAVKQILQRDAADCELVMKEIKVRNDDYFVIPPQSPLGEQYPPHLWPLPPPSTGTY